MYLLRDILLTKILKLYVLAKGGFLHYSMMLKLKKPAKEQEKVLLKILRKNKQTKYGRKYRFHLIDTVSKYRESCPENDYESLRPWIEEQDLTGETIITQFFPIRYAQTSGTSGKPKLIPVLKSTLKSQKKAQVLFIFNIIRSCPKALEGKILSIVGTSEEGYRVSSKIPFGSTSGHFYEGMSSIIRRKYVIPANLFTISDYALKYLVILRLALQRKDITFLSTANPSTIQKIVQVLNEEFESLHRDLKTGLFSRINELNESQKVSISQVLKQDISRAKELAELKKYKKVLKIQDIWPNLKVVACWTGGSCAIFLESLKMQFCRKTVICDLGYLSSEFRGTIPLNHKEGFGVPTLDHNYFEFVEVEQIDSLNKPFKGLHELKLGKLYYVFVTSDCGLYRYNMYDILRVGGFIENTPLLKFVQKGKGSTNITGEKLYEEQVIESVREAEIMYFQKSFFYMMLADEVNCNYILFYENHDRDFFNDNEQVLAFQTAVDSNLRIKNIEYEEKRKSER